jgi:A118 family predicted phage portal protein
VHILDENQFYVITSFTLDEDGKVIGDVNSVHTQCPYPWFSLIRKSGVNIHDYGSPFGVSIIDGNEDVLKGLDAAFDNFIVDFVLGRKQVFMNTTMFAHDTEGNAIAPQMSGANLFINVGDKLKDEKDLIHEFNPSLRVEENSTGVQKMLDLFSFKIGLGMKHYQFEGGVIQTATEYTGSKQDLVQNAAKEMIGIKQALIQITRAVLWIGRNVLKAPIDADTNITVHSDDSYIIDQETERKRWREEIALGIRSRVEYRMHFYGESEEEAIKAVEAAQGSTDLFAE